MVTNWRKWLLAVAVIVFSFSAGAWINSTQSVDYYPALQKMAKQKELTRAQLHNANRTITQLKQSYQELANQYAELNANTDKIDAASSRNVERIRSLPKISVHRELLDSLRCYRMRPGYDYHVPIITD